MIYVIIIYKIILQAFVMLLVSHVDAIIPEYD